MMEGVVEWKVETTGEGGQGFLCTADNSAKRVINLLHLVFL